MLTENSEARGDLHVPAIRQAKSPTCLHECSRCVSARQGHTRTDKSGDDRSDRICHWRDSLSLPCGIRLPVVGNRPTVAIYLPRRSVLGRYALSLTELVGAAGPRGWRQIRRLDSRHRTHPSAMHDRKSIPSRLGSPSHRSRADCRASVTRQSVERDLCGRAIVQVFQCRACCS
jgi:hypothetical protein